MRTFKSNYCQQIKVLLWFFCPEDLTLQSSKPLVYMKSISAKDLRKPTLSLWISHNDFPMMVAYGNAAYCIMSRNFYKNWNKKPLISPQKVHSFLWSFLVPLPIQKLELKMFPDYITEVLLFALAIMCIYRTEEYTTSNYFVLANSMQE